MTGAGSTGVAGPAGEGAAGRNAGAVRHPGRLHPDPALGGTVRRLRSAGREAAGLLCPERPTGLTDRKSVV